MTIKVQVVIATEETIEVEIDGNPESAGETERAIEQARNLPPDKIRALGNELEREEFVEFWQINRDYLEHKNKPVN